MEVGIKIEWSGTGMEEVGKDKKTKNILVRVDKKYFRPSEVEILCGNASKAKNKLGWEPKISLKEMISEMVKYDLENELNGY